MQDGWRESHGDEDILRQEREEQLPEYDENDDYYEDGEEDLI